MEVSISTWLTVDARLGRRSEVIPVVVKSGCHYNNRHSFYNELPNAFYITRWKDNFEDVNKSYHDILLPKME
ncbi:hypothetical protein PIB30_056302 [Stylosanthes scabra]|uniref:Uncharacterized protein n=1 Tax=Stylosanthes scabra TaxID=79078 RepID=A0ABU6ZI45_9FABA|nr:hypothetical protein [Stylosanthes scabra]